MREKQPELEVTPEEEQAWREMMERLKLEYRSKLEREERDRARKPEVND